MMNESGLNFKDQVNDHNNSSPRPDPPIVRIDVDYRSDSDDSNDLEDGQLPEYKDQVNDQRRHYYTRDNAAEEKEEESSRRFNDEDGLPDYKAQVNSRSIAEVDVVKTRNNSQTVNAQLITDIPVAEARELTPSEITHPPFRRIELISTSKISCSVGKQKLIVSLIVICFVVVVAATLGGVCGAGLCRNSGNSDTSISTTAAPTTLNPTNIRTLFPTQAPTVNTRSSSILNFLNENRLSSAEIRFNLPTTASMTPQELATEWLIQSDPLQLTTETANDRFRLIQRFAIVTFWFESRSPWIRDTGWLTEEHECDWFGLTCITRDLGEAGTQRVISEIGIANNNLSGGFPHEIGLLTHMQHISLWQNFLSGSLPETMGELTDMDYFEVWGNNLSGTIPESFSQWSKLELFSIWGLNFVGTIPRSVPEQWTKIRVFYIYDNDITGSLPESIGAWTDLRDFRVNGNSLNGSIPETVGNWTNVEIAYFESNAFNGTIPESIKNWGVIKDARFQGNQFSISIPNGICNITSLTTLGADCFLDCDCCTFCA